MFDEITPIVLESLINYKKGAKVENIEEDTGYEKIEVGRSLTLLCDLGLVFKVKEEKATQFTYSLIKEIKGIHLAKAAQLGIDLSAFDEHFKIDPKEKKLALELATQAEKIKHLDISKRKPLLQKRDYLSVSKSDDVYENLLLLLEASNMTLYEYIESMASKDPYLNLLITMHQEAESSLRDYAKSLK